MSVSPRPDSKARAKQRASDFYPSFNHHFRLGQPLMFASEAPEAFVEEVLWRYRNKLREAKGPVPITQLLNGSEIDDVKCIVTAADAPERTIREIWEKKEYEDRAKGGRKSAKKMGIARAVEESILQFQRLPTAKEVWNRLGSSTSQDPLRVTGADGRRYEVYRDGDQLMQVRDQDGVEKAIKCSTYYKSYLLPARALFAPVLEPGQ